VDNWNIETAAQVLDSASDSGWKCSLSGVWNRTLTLASVTDHDTRDFIVYALGQHDAPPGVSGRIYESSQSQPLVLIICISPTRKHPPSHTPRSLFGAQMSAVA